MAIEPTLQHMPDKIPYVDLHVTIFASPHKLSPRFFKLPPSTSVPEVVLTTLPEGTNLGSRRDGVGPAGFWSISLLRKARKPGGSPDDTAPAVHYVYKIFSPERLTASFLTDLLAADSGSSIDPKGENRTIVDMPTSVISWYHEKVWQSYPYLYPRVTFEEIQLAPNLWYTSGIESFISTMETSSLAGMNVAALMMSGWVRNFDLKLKVYEKMSKA
jgi:prenylcysteine oxidase/farnesylcysteine lyase